MSALLAPALAALAARLVSARSGLVRRVYEVPLQPGDPAIFVMLAQCAELEGLRDEAAGGLGEIAALRANGAGFSREEALWCMFGETVERYCGALCEVAQLRLATAAALGEQALPLAPWIGFSRAQLLREDFPFVPPNAHALMSWASGQRLADGAACWLPAPLVWTGYRPRYPGELAFPRTSSGLAAGPTASAAQVSGLLELIERDAFCAAWLLGHRAEKIDPVALAPYLRPACQALTASLHWRVYLNYLETDIGLPVVAAVVLDHGEGIAACGAAAGLSFQRAAEKALLEAHHTRLWAQDLARTPGAALAAEAVRDFEGHVRHYLDPARRAQLAPLLEGPPMAARRLAELAQRWQPPADAEAGLARVLSALAGAGFSAYSVDITRADIAELGFCVTRCVVPGLQPLHAGYGLAHEDPRRLQAIAAHWGCALPTALTRAPHPFP